MLPLSLIAAALIAAEAPTLIVFDLVPEKGVERGATNLLTEIVLNEVNRTGRYTVIGQKDLDKMLTWEQNKQLKGCSDTSCLIQIAGAMGASFYIEGSLGVMGDQYIVTLKLMDAQKVKIVGRDTLMIERNETVLVKAIPGLVAKIIPAPAAEAAKPKDKDPATTAAAERRVERSGAWIYRLAGYVSGGVGIAMLGTGAFCYVKAGTIYDGLTAGSYAGDEKNNKIDEGKILDRTGIGLMAGGGALAVASGVLLYLGYTDTTVAVTADRGLTVSVGGRF